MCGICGVVGGLETQWWFMKREHDVNRFISEQMELNRKLLDRVKVLQVRVEGLELGIRRIVWTGIGTIITFSAYHVLRELI